MSPGHSRLRPRSPIWRAHSVGVIIRPVWMPPQQGPPHVLHLRPRSPARPPGLRRSHRPHLPPGQRGRGQQLLALLRDPRRGRRGAHRPRLQHPGRRGDRCRRRPRHDDRRLLLHRASRRGAWGGDRRRPPGRHRHGDGRRETGPALRGRCDGAGAAGDAGAGRLGGHRRARQGVGDARQFPGHAAQCPDYHRNARAYADGRHDAWRGDDFAQWRGDVLRRLQAGEAVAI